MAYSVPTTVIAGNDGTATWGNLVVAAIVELQAAGPHHLRYLPGGDIDAPAGAAATWLTLGSVTVPTWATTATVDIHLNNFIATTTGEPRYLLRGIIAGGTNGTDDVNFSLDPSTTQTHYVSWTSKVTALASGARDVTIYGSRAAGTGLARANTGTLVTATILFRG